MPATRHAEAIIVGSFLATIDPEELHARLGMFKNGSYEGAWFLEQYLRSNPELKLTGHIVEVDFDTHKVRYLDLANVPEGVMRRLPLAEFGRVGYGTKIQRL